MASLVVMPRAELQILAIVDYLSPRNPAGARRFQQQLDNAYRQLCEFPLSGPRASAAGTRRLVMAPYILTYRIVHDTVEVLDIRHGRQRMPAPAEGG